jgi:hypothetical protein
VTNHEPRKETNVPTTKTVPVTMRALLQRLNRKLASQGELLKKARSARASAEVGDYYVIHVNKNVLMRKHVDPETLGRKLGVLQSWESVE